MIIINKDTPKDETVKNIIITIIILCLGFGVFTALGSIFPKKLFTHEFSPSEFIVHDEIVQTIIQDSAELARDENLEELPFAFFDALETQKPTESFGFNIIEIDNSGNRAIKGMSNFFTKLQKLEEQKTGNLRIAYFGDSMTEGDYIVQTLRTLLQKKYGGLGVGIVPISTPNNAPRHTIKQNFSPNWQYSSILKLGNLPIGITGAVSFANTNDTLWVSYKSGTQKIINPTLIYGKSENFDGMIPNEMIPSGKMIISSENSYEEVSLNPQNPLNFVKINSDDDSISLKFVNIENIPLFGVDFSTANGIFVDNFSLRGSSGLPLVNLNKKLMNAFQKKLDYDLIILQFGANVIRNDITRYKWYSDKMTKVVEHLRESFPDADILVISAADKATKYGTEIKTDTLIYSLLRSQREYATATDASFINLFAAMGGEGTMAKWVAAEPPMGAKDLIHFSPAGYKIIANAIFDKLEEEFEKYKEIK